MNRRKFLNITTISGGALLASPAFSKQIFEASDFLLALPSQISAQTDADFFKLEGQRGKTQWSGKDVLVELKQDKNSRSVYLTAGKTGIRKIVLSWKMKFSEQAKYLPDQWERTYGDVGWKGMNDFSVRPWYFMFFDGLITSGIGVKTGPAAFCWWHVAPNELQLTLDVRNGGSGVILDGRKLKTAELLIRKGLPDESSFEATRQFCQLLCDKPRLPLKPIYGINDWYFAYGNNSDEDITRNCIYFSDLITNTSNKPHCVIDAGWAKAEHASGSNESNRTYNQLISDTSRFKDMAKLADRINLEGFKPGIWIRPLWSIAQDADNLTLSSKTGRSEKTPQRILDPSIPESKERIASYFTKVLEWGYEMIKHDYSTYDLFGYWGFEMLKNDFTPNGWHFNDQGKTSAEIVLDLYQTIRQASGNALLIGCNTLTHLSAGIFELQRTGDDTSGREWARTKKMGINTLAFRLPQHRSFYYVDADCVGLTTKIPWNLNKQWMDLLARSGTALFISGETEALVPEVRKAIREAFSRASEVQDHAEPLDWMESLTPYIWKFNGQEIHYNWT
jgi:alpha-galactosidase